MKKLNIIYFFLCLVLIYSACSCGARKVNKSHSKEETKNEVTDNSKTESVTDTNVKTITTTTTDDKNESVTEETIYKPENSSKEAFIIEKDGTKTVLNNSTKTVRKVTNKNNTNTQTAYNTAEVKKEAVKEQKAINNTITSKKENSSKAIEKKQFNPFELLWLIIPLLIIYWAYRKYKNLPFVPKF